MILFSETDLFIDGMFALSQLLLSDKKTFTIFGELHGKYWECKGNKLSPWEYCALRVSKNKNCVVLLEFSNKTPQKNIPLIQSKSITGIYETLQKQNQTYKIIPYDIRSQFIGLEHQQSLYHSDYVINKLKNGQFEDVKEKYIQPFFNKLKYNPEMFDISKYSKETKQILNRVQTSIIKDFKLISKQINTKTPKNINENLKKIWQKVTDYFILTIILKDNDFDEYIIVTGMHHFDFISEELRNICFPVNLQEFEENRGSNNCVAIYEPLIV
tara:strand:+ start:3912 stop:4724 length:813 start_codon:yes stop_codon:yes gene_type:complete